MWLLAPAVVAVGTACAVVIVTASARVSVAVCGAVATVLVAIASWEAVRRGRVITTLRAKHAEQDAALKRQLAQQESDAVRLAQVRVPDVVARLQSGEQREELLRQVISETDQNCPFEASHQTVLRSVIEAVTAEEDLRDSAQRAFVNIARRVQAIVHQQATDLREMQDRHGRDPEMFGDLLHLDHGTALIGRLADSIAVLGGARPGRQWMQSVPLFSVLRGAMSRILDYQRVELHSVMEVAVVGPAVEPLIHALAELLDNATRYSPPQTRVHLTASEVQSGVAVEVEDGGVGLTAEARARAERVLSQASTGIDLNDLGETPRLGLAVVGRLAQENNFQISLRPSAYAGVRAVLVIPRELITTVKQTDKAPRLGALPGMRRSIPSQVTPELAAPPERAVNGLPQRRRRGPGLQPRAQASTATTTAPPPAPPARLATGQDSAQAPVQPGMWLAAFQSGVTGEEQVTNPGSGTGDDSLSESE